MDEGPSLYAVLGVSPSATPAEVTHAFRAKLRALHPDSRPAADGAELHRVLSAYQVLRDPVRRRDYDRTTTETRQPRPPDLVVQPSGPVEVTVTHRDERAPARESRPPLWAGPVRRHR